MPKLLQPRFSILIEEQDVTASISGTITYDQQPDVISTLDFVLSGRSHFIQGESPKSDVLSAAHVVKLGNSVRCFMGTMDAGNYKEVFSGNVKTLNPVFDESGLIKTTLSCAGPTFSASQNVVSEVYPSENATRSWASSSPITATEIIEGIAGELSIPIKEIVLADDREYTFENPIVQYRESDWTFLRRLAKRLGCNVWGEHFPQEGGEKLYFVDKSSQMNTDETTGFIHPLRKPDNSYEFSELRNSGERILFDIDVEQDLAAAEANVRITQQFDKATGEDFTVFQVRKEDSQGQVFVKYYKMEVDEAKLPTDPTEQERVKNIAYNLGGNNSYSLEDVEKYFKPASFNKDETNVIDKPWFGITITGKIDGDVNLIAKRSYPVRGIGRYGSDNLEENYYLNQLKHIISEEGFITEVTLKL